MDSRASLGTDLPTGSAGHGKMAESYWLAHTLLKYELLFKIKVTLVNSLCMSCLLEKKINALKDIFNNRLLK